ncbi:MAG: aquaporin, partial [Caldilineaceae bacterium]|nr:aquaporin [Caldilineaceae bacterium]
IGVALMVLHLVSIPVTTASLNPARSTAPAIFAGGTALAHLWMFWIAPILGGIIGGVVSRWLQDE